MSEKAVVVGGGIAGILSAMLLKEGGYEVSLVEREDTLGGLLRSRRGKLGHYFDYGTHILSETGDSEVDQKVFDEITPKDWMILDFLKAGNYFGKLNEENMFPDARCLPRDIYERGMIEMLERVEIPADIQNFPTLHDELDFSFGPTLTRELFDPIIQKHCGYTSNHLIPGSNVFFGTHRVMAFTAEASREIKKIPVYDSKFSLHSYKEGLGGRKFFYPREGGIETWIKTLRAKLDRLGVKTLTRKTVSQLKIRNAQIHQVELNNQEALDCDLMVWTLPAFILMRLAGISIEDVPNPPKPLISTLHHYVVDQPYKTDLHFFRCDDPRFKMFRTTLYGNITDQKAHGYPLTVEALCNKRTDLPKESEELFAELKDMRIIDSDSKILEADQGFFAEGFPVMTHAFRDKVRAQNDVVNKRIKNLQMVGRSTQRAWFMAEVLKDTYHTVCALREKSVSCS